MSRIYVSELVHELSVDGRPGARRNIASRSQNTKASSEMAPCRRCLHVSSAISVALCTSGIRPSAAFARLFNRTSPPSTASSKICEDRPRASCKNQNSMSARIVRARPTCRYAGNLSVRKSRNNLGAASRLECGINRKHTFAAIWYRGKSANVSHQLRIACNGVMMTRWPNDADEP